jgi:hypothetical protein
MLKYVRVCSLGGRCFNREGRLHYDTDWCRDLRGRIDLAQTFSNVWITCYLKFKELSGKY